METSTVVCVLLVGVLVCVVVSQTPCDTTADCQDGECCLSKLDLGKRQIHGSDGTCRPLGGQDDKCHVNDRFDTERIYYSVCPCQTSLTCHSIHVNEEPYGPIGNCTA